MPLTTTPSKDVDARWIKKNGQYKLGYKQHTRTDHEGYIDKLHVTPANAHECKHFEVLLDDVDDGVLVHADKGYSSSENRQHLVKRGLRDGIMHKANRGQALTAAQKAKNKQLSKIRYVVEQTFGTLHRLFRHSRASYFLLESVTAQCYLKAFCVHLLKAGNRIRVPIAA